MLRNITIRGGLTLVIGLFVAFLLVVIGVAYGALKLTNESLVDTQRSAQSLAALKTSSERLLQVRLALGGYETLFSVGKSTEGLLEQAHKVLVDSNKDFAGYSAGPFTDDEEARLARRSSSRRWSRSTRRSSTTTSTPSAPSRARRPTATTRPTRKRSTRSNNGRPPANSATARSRPSASRCRSSCSARLP